MISNTDSMPFVYSTQHIRVKVYKGKGAQATVSVGVMGSEQAGLTGFKGSIVRKIAVDKSAAPAEIVGVDQEHFGEEPMAPRPRGS
jgi:hypothetical protein